MVVEHGENGGEDFVRTVWSLVRIFVECGDNGCGVL